MPVSKVLARKLNNLLNHQNRLAATEKAYLKKARNIRGTQAYFETVQQHNTLYRQVANKCINDLKIEWRIRKSKIERKLLNLLGVDDMDIWYAEAVKYEYIIDNGESLEMYRKYKENVRAREAVYVKGVCECVGCGETKACTRTPHLQWVCRMCWP